jgi:hypothetical protein
MRSQVEPGPSEATFAIPRDGRAVHLAGARRIGSELMLPHEARQLTPAVLRSGRCPPAPLTRREGHHGFASSQPARLRGRHAISLWHSSDA